MSSQENNPDSPSAGNSKDAMFEPKPKPKMIRVLTVLAYVLSVSMAAILLSIYYIFMWDGRPHLGPRRSYGEEMMAPNNYTNHTDNYGVPIFSKQIQDDIHNFIKEKIPNNVTQEDDQLVNVTKKDYDDEFKSTTMEMTNSTTNNEKNHDLQQQITAIEMNDEAIVSSSTVPTTSEETSVTWPDYDQFERKHIFLKKILDDDY